MNEYIYRDESYKIIGACMEVHKQLGCGFLEPVYQKALAEEFKIQGIPYIREKRFKVFYKGINLEKEYVADFVCYDKIILELKALSDIESTHQAQIINYLKLANMKLGIIINFGETSLQQERIPNKYHKE